MPIQSLSEDEIQAFLAAERERCAKVADGWAKDWGLATSLAAVRLVAAIRNLPPQAEGGQP